MKMTCQNCGEDFKSDRQRKFCSRNCYLDYTRKENKKLHYTEFICEWCGKGFERQNKQVKAQKNTKFCSRDCLNAYQKQNNRTVSCGYCGKDIERTLYDIETRDKHYCSKDCHFKDKQTGKIINCRTCGKPVYIIPSKERYYNKLYCSNECRLVEFLNITTNAKPLSDSEYKQLSERLRHTAKYLTWRAQVLKQNPKCKICGSTSSLHVHHIISLYEIAVMYNFDYNKIVASEIYIDINNGVTFCKKCHDAIHF